MSKELEKIKESRKSTFYENEDYKVKLTQGGYVCRKNEMLKPWYDYSKEEGEYIDAYMEVMTVESKKTGKKSTKRVYQENPIYDLQNDLESKSMFCDIFNKIDK